MEDLFGNPIDDKTSIPIFADVILPVPIPWMFTYMVPREMEPIIGIGFRVIVQFGTRKILTGIVGKIHQKPPKEYDAKPLLELLDNQPMVNPLQIKFWHWIADYYCCHIGEVMNAALPSGMKLNSESRLQLNPTFQDSGSDYPIDEREKIILDHLETEGELTFEACGKILELKSAHHIIKSLVAKEMVLVYEQLKEKFTPKIENRIRLSALFVSDKSALEALFAKLESKPKQEEIILKYLQQVPVYKDEKINHEGLDKKLLTESGISVNSLRTLIKNGIFEEFTKIISRFENLPTNPDTLSLSPVQEEALNQIKEAYKEKQTVLLHGITGSGKTSLYIKLVQEVMDSGSQVLLLLPEIALTTQMVNRLTKVFGNKMGVFHSKYSDNERVEVWQGVIQGRFQFVVGVRSAVFLPFDSLGLIIIDEEHETSYKQHDPAPRYHARDTAIMLAYLHQSKVLLGSATPSFESYYNARQKKYGLVELNLRYGEAQLPHFHMADILADKKKNLLKLDTTRLLREKIQEALNNQEQVLIFQNRRGYAPYINCEDCSWVLECDHCDVSLTYHQFGEEMRCHYCGFKQKVPTSCPACGSNNLVTVGQGTEKIEENLAMLFPEARIARMDLDTTRSKYGYQNLLENFSAGNVDILVGTQMITKGLDFGNVTVVGIVDADRLLYFPDFRSGERAFQQITQVAGRAGRRQKTGNVIIQSRKPDHPIYQSILSGDYRNFYLQEMGERQQFFYPPLVKNIKITSKHKEFKTAETAALHLKNLLQAIPVKKIILGPEKGLIGKIKNQYIFELLIKLDKNGQAPPIFKEHLKLVLEELAAAKAFKSVRFIIDVDPV
ncbi:replication restart helicase PriA [Anditalea andensis]|uniref:Replication restart protein PriA n=1 Tax=Anditalea andensis TaxID=1048983 RepID=A0A074KYG6_9BACT|nr:primosomal protein N' [Anditalea andensis]KEO72608.1 primosomal protein N' [Anditalea andensis]